MDKELIELKTMVDEAYTLGQQIKSLEEQTAETKRQLRILDEGTIPDKMDDLGLQLYKTDEGLKVECKFRVHAVLPHREKAPEQHLEALAWLKENNYDDLIKTGISYQFTKGEHNVAVEFIAMAKEQLGVSLTTIDGIHWGTYSSWAKEILESGLYLPQDKLGIHSGMKAIVKKES